MTILLIWVLFNHWIGDFLCQTRWMAQNKSKRLDALLLHVFIYTAVITASTFFLCSNLISFTIITFLLHLITDLFTSKISSNAWKHERFHFFFSVIGLDQFIHSVSLILVTEIFLTQ